MPHSQVPRHVKIGSDYFRIDEGAEVAYRRLYDSVMAPRADISGVPGAINLQRDVWLWTMSDFVGGEGRLVFDSSDPLGPPTFYKTEGGVDVRVPGEISLHPDENLVSNETGGGSAATNTSWTNGANGGDFTTVTGSPTYGVGPNSTNVTLSVGDKVRAPARNGTTGNVTQVEARLVNAQTKDSNKKVDVRLQVWNNTDSTSEGTQSASLRDEESVTLQVSFNETTGKTYHYRVENNDGGSGVSAKLKHVKEARYGTAPAASQDIRDVRLGIGDDVWATAWDGTNTDILRYNLSTDTWDQIVGNMRASAPRAMTGSDQYQYVLLAEGRIYRINGSGATQYTNVPTTSGVGEPLSVVVSNNKLYALFDQALFEITLDSTAAGLPFDEDEADYTRVISPAEMPKELAPDTTLRQHMCAITNGVRFFINQRGEQTAIYEYSGSVSGAPIHMLPKGYIATAIRHYANITFIAAQFTNEASTPADTKTGIFFISADNLLRFLGYLRFWDSNQEPVRYIESYGHDVYFLQGRRIWRYGTGTGGVTLENECDAADETKVRALARMDKKFWVAVEGVGTFVATDAYSDVTSWLYSPIWDYDLPDTDKVLLGFTVNHRPLPASTRLDLEYKINEAETWTSAGSQTTAATTKTEFTISTGSSTSKFRNVQWRLGLTSLTGTDTPRVLDVTTRAYVLDYERGFDMTILAEDDSPTDRLVSQHKSGRAKAAALFATADAKNLTTFQTWYEGPDGQPQSSSTYSTVALEDPFYDASGKGEGSIRLKVKVLG